MSLAGKEIIQSLNDKNTALISAAINPHGKWGLMLDSLLVGYRANTPLLFNQDNPAAAEMYEQAKKHPYPTGIIQQATKKWQATKPATFYGGSYSAPTPQEWFLQEFPPHHRGFLHALTTFWHPNLTEYLSTELKEHKQSSDTRPEQRTS